MKGSMLCALLAATASALADEPSDQSGVQLWRDGPYWADRNVGAEEPWSPGLYFWWGDTVGYKWENGSWAAVDGSAVGFSFDRRGPASVTFRKDARALTKEGWLTTNGVLAPAHDAARVHWGGDWRMPTKQELIDLAYNKCEWTTTTTNGVKVCIVRGRGDYADASMVLPLAGWGDGAGLSRWQRLGHLYASDPRQDGVPGSWRLKYGKGCQVLFYHWDRFIANSVRPVRGGLERPVDQGRWVGTERKEVLIKPAGRGCAPREALVSAPAEASVRKGVRLWEGGPYWADRNIGAASPSEAGLYFWWGDVVGYTHGERRWIASDGSNPRYGFDEHWTKTFGKDPEALRREGFTTDKNALSPEFDAARAHWGDGWRMPTRQELNDLCYNKCDWFWATNGVRGCIVRGRGEYASASIFLPVTGVGVETKLGTTESGFLWSVNPYMEGPPSDCTWRLVFGEKGIGVDYCWDRYAGAPVRPVRDCAE